MKLIFVFITFLFISVTTFAQNDAGKLIDNLNNAKTDSQQISSYTDLFNYYSYSNSDSALYYVNDGLKRFTENNNRLGIAKMTSLLGTEDETQGRMAIAKRRLSEAMTIFKELNNKDGIATVDDLFGVIEGRTGNYVAATKYFTEALKLFESTSNKEGIVATYLKLGVVNEVSKNVDQALEYYHKAMALMKGAPMSPNTVFLYNNIAIVYGKKGDFKKALEYLQLALDNSNKPEFAGVRIHSLTNMGIVYEQSGKLEEALKYYNEALQLAKDKNLPEETARAIINIASVTSKNDPKKSIEYLQQALELAQKINQRTMELEIYDYLGDYYQQAGDYKNAFETLQAQKNMQDSLFSLDKAREIANIQSEFELETNEKVKELQLLGHKNLLQRNIIVMVALIMAITLIVLTFFLRKITRLNEQLFKRETELQKSNTVKDKLFSIIGHDLRGPIANIPVMLRILQDETTSTEERKYIYDTLVEHSQASLETLDKLLYWGQAQLKGIGLKSVEFNPQKFLINDLQLIKSSTEQKQITVINNLPENMQVLGDPAHFDFIIRNLLSNAVKFTHAGGSVTINADKNSTPGFTIFAVKDTGVGISKSKTAEIFEPFSNSTKGTADERGTSIGLMLCKEFVIQNGGEIWVESEEGKGSTFYFSFKSI